MRGGNIIFGVGLLLCVAAATLSCQSGSNITVSDSPMQATYGNLERIMIPSKHMSQTIPVDLWTPDGYPEQGVKYRVVYMNDGQMLFDREQAWNGQAWMADSTAHNLISKGRVAPYIIVGVHNFSATRTADYIPQKVVGYLEESERRSTLERIGNPLRADRYLQFLTDELKPYIDQNYPVDNSAEATVIMGSSMGGLISLYAICEYPEVFGGAGCLSTHLAGWGADGFVDTLTTFPEALCRYLDDNLPEATADKNRIYFDYGDQTLDAYYPKQQAKVDETMRRNGYDGQSWQTLLFAGDRHDEISWANRLSHPMEYLFSN